MPGRIQHAPEMMPQVAVRLVEALLLEFFYYDTFLYVERALAERQGQHAVTFKP